MLKDLFSNRLFIGALAFFVLIVVGGTLYLQHVEKQSEREFAETQERLKAFTEKQNRKPIAEVPEGDTSQGGHWHGDEWHADPHDTPGDRPVLPPLQTPETPQFVRPVSDTQDVTIADRVAASGDVPDRAELEAMSDERLSELMDASYEKARELSPEVNKRMDEWANVHAELTRHAKTRAETDAILAEHADSIKPLREAMESAAYEYLVHSTTFNRASKISQARFLMEHEPQTDAFWTKFWANF